MKPLQQPGPGGPPSGGALLQLSLPSLPSSATRARHAAQDHLDGLPERAVADAATVVTELVTNAVRHGSGGDVELQLWLAQGTVRGLVSDRGGRSHPAPRAAGADGGFGLHIVAALSSRWGAEADPTRVWFELCAPID